MFIRPTKAMTSSIGNPDFPVSRQSHVGSSAAT
jgi:hypothetical protein